MAEQQALPDNEVEGDWGGPYIQTAAFCTYALNEPDGAVSLIRVVDIFHVPEIPTELRADSEATGIQILTVISLKRGSWRGETCKVVLRGHRPNGTTSDVAELDVALNDSPSGGVSLRIALNVSIAQHNIGLHIIDVLVNGRMATRMPFEIRRAEPEQAAPETEGEGQ